MPDSQAEQHPVDVSDWSIKVRDDAIHLRVGPSVSIIRVTDGMTDDAAMFLKAFQQRTMDCLRLRASASGRAHAAAKKALRADVVALDKLMNQAMKAK